MPSIKRALKYILWNRSQFLDSCVKNFGGWLPDKVYLSLRYRLQMGQWINWKNPQTFTEKIQWLKVSGFRQEYTTMVDKLAVKKYVSQKIGEEYIIPTINLFESPDEIDWDTLPQQFVLKTTHGGGSCGVVVCSDKGCLDTKKALAKLQRSYRKSAGRNYREHPYYEVPKRVILEQYMCQHTPLGDQINRALTDYKFFCFNGEPQYCQVICNRDSKETIDFYDLDWNLQPFVGLNPTVSNSNVKMEKPVCFDEMLGVCRRLAENIPFVRVDLFEIDCKVYFGEMTFYPAGGFGSFVPNEWNRKLGDMIIVK